MRGIRSIVVGDALSARFPNRIGTTLVVACLVAFVFPVSGPAGAAGDTFVAPDPMFEDAAADAGLDFTCKHWHKDLGLAPRWFVDVLFCASPVLGDFNGDGFTDIFFPNMRYTYQSLNDAEAPRDQMLLNNGDGTFTDITDFLQIADEGYSGGGAAVDFDNDGDLDIIVVNFPNQRAWYAGTGLVNTFDSPATDFYTNNGDGTFTHAVPAGLETGIRFDKPDNQMGQAVAVADYDGDGDLDIYRGNYIQYRLPEAMPAGLQKTVPDSNNLFRNRLVEDGVATFEDVTVASGASLADGRTFAVNFVDLNGDHWPDLYVANDENRNELYLNDGDGTFTQKSALDHRTYANDPRGSMCSEAADWDNDLDLDLYMTHYENEVNGYYRNHGDATFAEASSLGDLGGSFEILGWGCPALDFDNDADLDMFVANGHMLPIGGQFPGGDDGYELPNFLYRNTLRETGVHSFEEIGAASGVGAPERFATSGAMPIDIDLDGTLEIIAIENNDVPTKLYRNTAAGNGHWLSVTLDSGGANRFGIGATVEVTAGGLTQMRPMMTGNTLASGSVAPLHFGLGDHDGPVTVKVTWPRVAGEAPVVQTVSTDVDRPVRIVKGVGVEQDTLAPAVDVDVLGTLGEDGWYVDPVLTIDLSFHERGIGAQGVVTEQAYSLDGGPLTPYTGPFQVSGEGEHRLTVFAADSNGNRAWYPTMFKIDSEQPICAIPTPDAGRVYFQDRDQGPSHDGRTYIVAPVQTPDHHATVVDDMVFYTQKFIGEYYGYETPPAPSTRALFDDTVGSYDGRTQVLVDASDVTSGVSRVEFLLDGTTWRTDRAEPYDWRAELRGGTVGEHTLSIRVIDVAGNVAVDERGFVLVPTTQDGAMNTVMDLVGGI